MKLKIFIAIPTVFVVISSSSQSTILGKESFTKVSIPENITQQMITQEKKSFWVFTNETIYYALGEGSGNEDATMYKELALEYNNTSKTYTFLCKEESTQNEYSISYKNTIPGHVLIQNKDGTKSFMCHN